QTVFGAQVQIWIVEQQPHRNSPQLAVTGFLAQCLVEWVIDPALLVLDLSRDGELIVFLRQASIVFFDHATDADSTKNGWGDGESFDHGCLLNIKEKDTAIVSLCGGKDLLVGLNEKPAAAGASEGK